MTGSAEGRGEDVMDAIMLTNWCLPSSFEMRNGSTGHFAGGREDVSQSDYL